MAAQSTLKSDLLIFSRKRFFALLFLVLICIISLLIIQIQHKVRHLETQYSKSLLTRVDLQEEKGKLLLEKYHLTALARVESIAKQQLQMSRVSKQSDRVQTLYFSTPTGGNDVVQ
jgi:cell division protein FtsL